jgi:hypothetical protein
MKQGNLAGRRPRMFLGLAATAALLLAGASRASAGTLDQQQLIADTGFQIHTAANQAQTITAGLSGGVDQVDLFLETSGMCCPSAPLTVEIRNVDAGQPGTTVLASQTVAAAGVSTTPAFVPVVFPTPAPVVAGTQYAIVAYSTTSATNFYSWIGTMANAYAGGESFFDAPPDGSWTASGPPPHWDTAFKTYVALPATQPGPTGQPGPAGQRSRAVKRCKRRAMKQDWSKKKLRKCKKRAKRLPV